MKNVNYESLLILGALFFGFLALCVTTGCSHHEYFRADFEKAMTEPENKVMYTDVRSKWSDKNMRIMVDPESGDIQNALEVQTLLVNQDKWTVVDRGIGFKSMQKEQDLIHIHQSERFDNKQKWSHWGKQYGVGAIILPHFSCDTARNGYGKECDLNLSMIDASTGEIIVAVRGEGSMHGGRAFDWEDMVKELSDKYPHKFQKDLRYRNILDYEDESVENSRKKKFQ